MIEDFDELCATRTKCDADIERWAARINDAWLNEDLTWFSGAANRDVRAPRRLLVAHFFNPHHPRPGPCHVDRRRGEDRRHRPVPGGTADDRVALAVIAP
jgi:hypothetical protein